MKLHRRHHWIFARPALYGGVVDVCAVDDCPARRYRPAPGDGRCGLCRAGRHADCRTCSCCTCIPNATNAGSKPGAVNDQIGAGRD